MSNSGGFRFFNGLIVGSIVGAVAAFFLSRKSDKDTMSGKLGDLIAKGKISIKEAILEGQEAAARKEAELHPNREDDHD